MATFIICKNCGQKLRAERPIRNVRVNGNVTYSGVQLNDNSINFSKGGGINLGPGGSITFGGNSGTRLTCPTCKKTSDYSSADFIDE